MRSGYRFCIMFIVLAALATCWGCSAGKVAQCTGPEDNPRLHYVTGMELIEKGQLLSARARFERALYCQTDFPPAYDGLAIIAAKEAAATPDQAVRAASEKRMADCLKKANSSAATKADKFAHAVAVIRTQTALAGPDFIKTAKAAHGRAEALDLKDAELLYYEGREAADYYMGLAFRKAQDFDAAKGRFKAVLDAKSVSRWNAKADRAWNQTDRTVRAMAGQTISDLGKKIAVRAVVTRAELTSLLTHELGPDALNVGPSAGKSHALPVPIDIADSPVREEILTVLRWNLRGLEPAYDKPTGGYLFQGAMPVKRGEMAFILEDMLIKATRDEKIASAYLGQEKSPFSDIKPTSRYYNAVMNATTRGLMEGETGGYFRVDDPVTGADAVLAVRTLKQKMYGH